jgi:hypothetical protein
MKIVTDAPPTGLVAEPHVVEWIGDGCREYGYIFNNLPRHFSELRNGFELAVDGEVTTWFFGEGRFYWSTGLTEFFATREHEVIEGAWTHVHRQYVLISKTVPGDWSLAQKIVSVWTHSLNSDNPDDGMWNPDRSIYGEDFCLGVYTLSRD